MKPLIFLIVFAALFSTLHCSAQQFKVTWADIPEKKWEYGDAIELNNGNSLSIKFEKEKMIRSLNSPPPDPIIVLVDPDMKVLKEKKYTIGEESARDRRIRKIGTNIFLTYYTFEKREVYFFAVKINPETLTFDPRVTLGPFTSGYANEWDIDLKFSRDSSKVLLFIEGPALKKENMKFSMGVYDTDMKKIWSRNIELPVGSLYMVADDYDILNDGRVSVALKLFEKTVSRERVKEKSSKIPSYSYKLQIYAQQGPVKELSFDVKSNFIEGTRLLHEKDGTITVAGLYKRKHNGNIIGTFYTKVDASLSAVKNIQMLDFPEDLLKLVDTDDQGKSGGSDPGILPYLRINHILQRDNGTIDVVCELNGVYTKRETKSGSTFITETIKYDYGDIININLGKDGRSIFTRIPKWQEAINADYGLGFFPIVHGNKLLLLYNDDENNLTRDLSKSPDHFAGVRRGVLVAATIDEKGNLTREAIYSFKDDKRMALPRFFSQVSGNRFKLVSLSTAFLTARKGTGLLEIM